MKRLRKRSGSGMSFRLKPIAKLLMLSSAGIASWPALAAAEAINDSSDPLPYSGPSNITSNLIWVFFSLAIVIVLIVFVMKWLSQRNRVWGTNRSVRSLGGVALGQNNSLQVVELAGKIYVVGVGENVTLLDKVEDAEQVQAILEAMDRPAGNGWSPAAFTDLLSKFRKRDGKEPSNEQWNQEASSFQSMLNDNLYRQADRKQQLESLFKDDKLNERLMDDNEK
ncbi:flagellar biosynthetic protein FliO [Paenibacillus sp. NPDC058071]|uniref:flagellar biosynthetic protein FliO n=1 Tax=Paenibacillus sp. NPDC058071 TaxID=3346326 RepID=UPI0036D903FA